MRLIDADNLMKYALNQKSKTIGCNDIARFPTAYSVDKVIDELNELALNLYSNHCSYMDSKNCLETTCCDCTMSKVIEIVKGGAE